jgi:hypothetical protein
MWSWDGKTRVSTRGILQDEYNMAFEPQVILHMHGSQLLVGVPRMNQGQHMRGAGHTTARRLHVRYASGGAGC